MYKQALSLKQCGFNLDPLHTCYGCVACIAWCFCGAPNSGGRGSLFCLLLEPFSSYGVALPSLDMNIVLLQLAMPCSVDIPGRSALF